MYKSQISITGFVVLQLSALSHGLIAGLATSHLIPSSTTGFSNETELPSQHSREDKKYQARSIKGHDSAAQELSRRKRRCVNDPTTQPMNLAVISAHKTVPVDNTTVSVDNTTVSVDNTTVSVDNQTASIDLPPKSGDATYYATGLGACGWVSNDTSMIAAASHLLFDTFPGATANPNLNPICGRKVLATYNGKSVQVEIVDRCAGCAMYDLDFAPSAFEKLGTLDEGRLHNMTWNWS